MPLYEVQCEECEQVSNVRRPMNDVDSPWNCPRCGGEAHRTYRGVTFNIKPGWFDHYKDEEPMAKDLGLL